jgi:PmbA protein
MAAASSDQAELFYLEDATDNVEFNDGKLEKADSSLSSGIALRVTKNGRVGLAHTRNLLDQEALVKQALLSSGNGMETGMKFPFTKSVPAVKTFDPAIRKLDKKGLIQEGAKVIEYVKKRSSGQVNVNYSYSISRMGIMNSAGTRLEQESSDFMTLVHMVFPGTGTGLYRYHIKRVPVSFTEAELDELIDLYRISETQIVPETGAMPVIFMPMTMSSLLWRFAAAASPSSFYNKVSPLLDKMGEKIFSDKIEIYQDPHDPELSSSTGFDSEGTPTCRYNFVDKGVFKAIPADLNYADKLKLQPTGNGFRHSVESQPQTHPISVCMAPGTKTLAEMIAGIDRGIIAHSLMGAHSGNILNGDYSVGVSAGFYIENGKLTGRVKDCLLAGNVYDTFNRVGEIESTCQNLGNNKLPAILFDGVSVAGK